MARIGFQAVAWLPVPVACHIGYSWIGFNPTDDGWLPAVARRLAEGEVPHRDFIFVRPVFSALLQVPLVHLGGEYAIWLSRLWGWLTLGTICWIWTKLLAREAPPALQYVFYAISLLFCAHTFPVMGWHTIDGVLLCTLAVAILARDTPARRAAAFFTAGIAVLCRQNFVLFPPLLLLATGGRIGTWPIAGFWSALPSLIYIGVLAPLGGAPDFFEQFWSTPGSVTEVAILHYVRSPWFWSGTAGGLALAVGLPRLNRRSPAHLHPLASFLFLLLIAVLASLLWRGPDHYPPSTMGVFGLVLGLTAVMWFHGFSRGDRLILISALGASWVSAISIGYRTPSLMSGVLVLAAWRLVHLHLRQFTFNLVTTVTALLGAVAAFLAFSHARQSYPYRERPHDELTFDAGHALDGAAGLRTNEGTYATLVELSGLKKQFELEGRRCAVLTDCTAIWIRSATRNPLPCDWPLGIELGYNQKLLDRTTSAIVNLPRDSRIIVQKHLISQHHLGWFAVPTDSQLYYVQNWITAHCEKLMETTFFTVYSPALRPRQK